MSNNQEHVRWLQRELPELVSQGVLAPECALRIRDHYGELDGPGGMAKRWAVILFGMLGAALIGGGIILLLAHNWEELSRPLRAMISIAPLAVAAVLGAWILWTERPSVAWREGVGTAQTIAIGASIALVSQTYNLGGEFDQFMLTWSLLALPIGYLLRATFPVLLYLIGITVWCCSLPKHGFGLWYFPLLVAALPFVWEAWKTNRFHPRTLLLCFVLAITVCVGSGVAVGHGLERFDSWPVFYASLFVMLYLLGAIGWKSAAKLMHNPFQLVGGLGAVGLALVLSFSGSWRGWSNDWAWQQWAALATTALLFAAVLALWAGSWKRQAWNEVMLGALPLVVALGWIAAINGLEVFSQILLNGYLFGLGTGTLAMGLRTRQLGTVNQGMAILAVLILCRFFDTHFSFVVRGLAFILIGISFLAVNLVLLRGKGAKL